MARIPNGKIEELIPKLSEDELETRMAKIKPMIRFSTKTNSNGTSYMQDKEGDLYFIADIGANVSAFTAEPTNPATKAEEVNPNAYKTIETYHFGGSGIRFQPSIGEVLAQIPKEDFGRCVAFEVVGCEGHIKGTRDHIAETRLYENFPPKVLEALTKTA